MSASVEVAVLMAAGTTALAHWLAVVRDEGKRRWDVEVAAAIEMRMALLRLVRLLNEPSAGRDLPEDVVYDASSDWLALCELHRRRLVGEAGLRLQVKDALTYYFGSVGAGYDSGGYPQQQQPEPHDHATQRQSDGYLRCVIQELEEFEDRKRRRRRRRFKVETFSEWIEADRDSFLRHGRC